MLKRSRSVTSKQALMADHASLPSPTDRYIRHASSFFSSPRSFTGFASKGFSETDSLVSPTSILDIKPFSGPGTPTFSDRSSSKSPEPSLENKHPWEKLESGGVGLGLVDALSDDKFNNFSKPDSRMVLFGSQLKIQIPPFPPSVLSPADSPKSPADFGIKTRNSQLGFFSPGSVNKSPFGSVNPGLETPTTPRVFTGCLSASEMELSEDYTCVISHGPNPKTTHIFDNCIVESCCGVVGFSASRKENFFSDQSRFPSENFLSFCYACKKNLGQGKDIYMYRGEKAFCSSECRYQEMMFDGGIEKHDLD
ncbi:FCS-Like Zinc finger 8 [Macadamia integrifolia]|uniref:FCS-Like Zinc finger 8 n=1 Tax=Macadamia integrifolia TaxID=60698 RepID=UPI001C4F3E44|nr:FCS-Like Zinc finger 8 [Macadamia integrifolia]XP_042518038.1 FCS-Like Zinc finger 8 [Macadamia integrifolia]